VTKELLEVVMEKALALTSEKTKDLTPLQPRITGKPYFKKTDDILAMMLSTLLLKKLQPQQTNTSPKTILHKL